MYVRGSEHIDQKEKESELSEYMFDGWNCTHQQTISSRGARPVPERTCRTRLGLFLLERTG